MRNKLFQKYLNALSVIAMMGFLFLNTVGAVAFDDVVPEYATGVFNVADNIEGNLAFYNASRGFFLLPLSANGIPDDALPADNPILALADTIILSDSFSNESGLVIYRVDGTLWVNTFVGAGNESAHSVSYFGVGDFVMVTTAESDQCVNLTLSECRADTGFLNERSFSISFDGSAPASTIDIIDSGATPTAPLPDSASVDSTSTPTSTPEPVIQENGDGSATLISI